ncbi:MAG: sugar transferase [Gemmatimonadales bacterium]
MAKRLFDLLSATVALVVLAPVLLLAAVGIRLSSPGPVLHRAPRAGRFGRPFTMYKLRTMRFGAHQGARVTAAGDPRVFPLGRLLRRLKIDELPQLVNVLRGEMSVVGPRPEDPGIVVEQYRPAHWHTLRVRPGLSSPGSLYHDTHCVRLVAGDDPERLYLERVLPLKLALDLVYVRRASFGYDLVIIARTLWVIASSLAGRRRFPEPPELDEARGLVVSMRSGADEPRVPAARQRRRGPPAVAYGTRVRQ